ncbi:Sulfurtransferase TusA [invertebrate metagenome]|uniref:Sulfurtransferase TusA n=1 Tax=invertebrate metagenome TaxID=1711999 RepID=A0A2H9TBL9_9ZZZZ
MEQSKRIEDWAEFDHELDTCGLVCPEPVMLLHNKIRDIHPGQTLRILATDPSTQWDIPNFCRFLDHELLTSNERSEGETSQYCYIIRKAKAGS